MASKLRPAISGRFWVAALGILSPRTCEKPTPPFSRMLPFSKMQVRPDPRKGLSSGFCQLSTTNALPSKALVAETMRSCRPRK